MNCLPNCHVCNGLGYVSRNAEIGSPDFGKLFPCPNTPAEKMFDFAKRGIHPGDRQSWDDLKQVTGVVAMRKAIEEITERGHGFAFLWSDEPGLAKTVALKITVRKALEQKVSACYIRMSDILENLRSVYGDNKKFEDKYDNAVAAMERWASMPVLAIDEFEKARASEFEAEKKFNLIDKRYELNIENQVGITLIASNLNPESIEDRYMRSRIYDGRCHVVHVVGADARPAMEYTKLTAGGEAK